MKIAILIALLAAPLAGATAPFRLEPGEFRWFPFTVNQIPTEVDSSFQVISGDASVHMELLPMSAFRQFNRGREHETLAVSDTARAGGLRRVLDERGQYVVVIINKRSARPAMVSLEVSTDLNPNAGVVAKTISPQRRLAVILISFGIFFTTVIWAGVRLLRSIQS